MLLPDDTQFAMFIKAPQGNRSRSKGANQRIKTNLPIKMYTTTVSRIMATAAEMAIITTWLFSLEMENAGKLTQKDMNNPPNT